MAAILRLIGSIYGLIKGYGFGICFYGIPSIKVYPGGRFFCAPGVVVNSSGLVNRAGIARRTMITVCSGATLEIGRGSGMSGATIYCASSISIGERVNLGVNVKIYDTDLHAVDADLRARGDTKAVAKRKVVFEDDAWLGADVIILKGVVIGAGAVVGAGSVVTRSIPPGTIWAGNPARFIRNIH